MLIGSSLESVSFHVSEACNMNCKYCFTKYEYSGDRRRALPLEDSLSLIGMLSEAGFKKISFAGGEPTFKCDWLSDLILYAKNKGLVTMLVSNGTGLTDSFLNDLHQYLDWIGLSVDSLNLDNMKKIGRQVDNLVVDENYYFNRVEKIKEYKYKLKINTVVSKANMLEDLSGFINYALPLRWKMFQMFSPVGVSTPAHFTEFDISKQELVSFFDRHRKAVNASVPIVLEDVDVMLNSYVMIDPLGRFYQNQEGDSPYVYSSPILEIGVNEALNQIFVDTEKRKKRTASYEF